MSCQECGSEEIESLSPRTLYACGSSDYDQQPGTFHKGSKCCPHELSPSDVCFGISWGRKT